MKPLEQHLFNCLKTKYYETTNGETRQFRKNILGAK
jgi:hypothetical protein